MTIANARKGSFGEFTPGAKIMFHVSNTDSSHITEFGKYGFAMILSASDSSITLNEAAPVTDLTGLSCQVVTIPQFKNVTVKTGLYGVVWDATSGNGGILALNTSGTCDLTSGSLLSQSRGLPSGARPVVADMDNYYLDRKLPMSEGNGIIYCAANNLKLSANTRFGATWTGNNPNPVGGAGGTGVESNNLAVNPNGSKGSNNGDGGNGGNCWKGNGGAGGKSGEGGKNGALGSQGYANSGAKHSTTIGTGGIAGATVLIISNDILNFTIANMSTGGSGGTGAGRVTYVPPDTKPANNGGNGSNGGAGLKGAGGGGSGSVASYAEGGAGGGGGGGNGYGMIITSKNSTTVPDAPYATAYALLKTL